MINVTLPLRAISFNSAYQNVPRGKFCATIKSKRYRQFEKDALTLLPKEKMIEGEVEVTIEYYLRTRYENSDVDNLNKATIDIIETAGYIENDNKIISLNCTKYKADEDLIKIIITEA